MLKRKPDSGTPSGFQSGAPSPSAASETSSPQKKKQKADVKPFESRVAIGSNEHTQAIILADIIKSHNGPINHADLRRKASYMSSGHFELGPDLIGLIQELKPDIKYNTFNGLFEYKPEHDMRRPDSLESYIRSQSTKAGGVPIKDIRTHSPELLKLLPQWEEEGKILIMRNPGKMPLPELGAKARKRMMFAGEVAEPFMMEAGLKSYRSVFWDSVREMKEAPVGKIDLEFTEMWAKVETPPNADVLQLLSQLGHAVKPSATAVKAAPKASDKKKRTVRRDPKKLTNTHLLSYGIDLSKDYVPT